MEKIQCPACEKNDKYTNLRLYQINFKEAVYMCPEELCRYPKGSNWTYVEREIFKNDFKVENDSTDSDIEAITKLFKNRARKKVKKKFHLKSYSLNNKVIDSDSSNDEEIIKKAYNILLGNVLKNEKDHKNAVEEYTKLMGANVNKRVVNDKISNEDSTFHTNSIANSLNVTEDLLNLTEDCTLNSSGSLDLSSILKDSGNNKQEIIDEINIQKPLDKQDRNSNTTQKMSEDFPKEKWNDISDLLNFDDSNEKSASQSFATAVVIQNVDSQSIVENEKLIENSLQHNGNDISKLLDSSNDNGITKSETKLKIDELHRIECNNKIELMDTDNLIENVEVSRNINSPDKNKEPAIICKNITSTNDKSNEMQINTILETKKVLNFNACSIPIKIKVLNCENLQNSSMKSKAAIDTNQKTLNDNLIKLSNATNNVLKQTLPGTDNKNEIDIANIPIIFEDFNNSTNFVPEIINRSKTTAGKAENISANIKEVKQPNIQSQIKAKNVQKVVKINNIGNNKITDEQMKMLRQLVTKKNSKRINFIKTIDDIPTKKVKSPHKPALTKVDISAALRASGIKEASKNTKPTLSQQNSKPTSVNIITGKNKKSKSVASKFEGFSFTSKIIKPASAQDKTIGNPTKLLESSPDTKVDGKNELKADGVPQTVSPEKMENLSVLDDLLKDIDLDNTDLTNTSIDCGLEDVDNWLKTLVD